MAQPKLKAGDTVMMQHETEFGGMLLQCTVIRVKKRKYIFQVQIPFCDESFEFEISESELTLSLQHE